MTLGILGGMGPAATVYFYDLITRHTEAGKDSDHIDMIISSHASMPDRTDYITGLSSNDPAPVMLEDALKLSAFGADILAVPCNTAHYFLPYVEENCTVPFVNMVKETCLLCASYGCRKVGIMATAGTIASGTYADELAKLGIEPVIPSDAVQELVTEMIYRYVKAGKMPEREMFDRASEELIKKGADKIILACTELSILNREFRPGGTFIDSMEVLALRCIERCGKTPVGFGYLSV